MKGIIVRIHLKQFMVFTDVEVKPDRNLNVIIAPNGCGKSSLLAGIMLGLGGKPSDIGRARHVGDFVKSGYKEASIEIELFHPGKNYIILRNIVNGSNKSTWCINGDKVSQKQVEDLMCKLHIQVNNLCQVLPQDRVCEFSRMNPQTLLENTEKSVGSEMLLKYHNQLKEMTKLRVDCNNKLKDKTARLEKEVAINQDLEAKVKMMLKKSQFIKEIERYKQQLAWIVYQELYSYVQQLKTSLKEAKETEILQKKKEEQVTAGIEALKRNMKQLAASTKNKDEAKMNLEAKLQEAISHANLKKKDLIRIDVKLLETQQAENVRLKDLESLRHHLSKLENDLALYNSVPEEQTKKRIEEITERLLQIRRKISEISQEEERVQGQFRRNNHEKRAEEEKKKRLEDQANDRLNVLKTKLNHVYKAVMWLRENQSLFKSKIHEPIVLEIDVLDESYIKYVEQTIPARDLQAFVCEDIDDMKQFVSLVREQNKLPINVVHSGPVHKPLSSYIPILPVHNLPSYGFKRYIRDMFTAPEPVMKYLCRTAHIHLIPVGSSEIDGRNDSLPSYISTFYSDTNKYSVSRSRYTNEKLLSINSIGRPRLLCGGMNKGEVDKICAKIEELSHENESVAVRLRAIGTNRMEFENKLEELSKEKRKLAASIAAKDSTRRRIEMKLETIRTHEAERVDIEEVTRKANLEKNVIVASLCEVDEKIRTSTIKLDEGVREFAEMNSKVCVIKLEVKKREDDAKSIIKARAEQTAKVMELHEECKSALEKAKHLHKDALKFSNGKVPDDSFFDGITENRETLSRKIQELKAKADFMNNENKNIIVEYENRKKHIKEISGELQQLNEKVNEVNKNVSDIREKWLPDLKAFIEKINNNFGRYFAKLGCAGEVTLHSDDPDNYDLYGIYIKVKFRDGDKLQDLNHLTQSGGERSVATALYVISMQELTYVPFRCVDEINQGMDPVNERKVFQLLVDVTEDDDGPQYFLLTPKLLPGLTYNSKTRIINIINGSVQRSMGWWDIQQQIQTRRNWT